MECVLGIDTSNYTTSVAVTDEAGNVISDCRRLLTVKKGERGLRQQEALFQHIKALPELIEEAVGKTAPGPIRAVAVSERPRPVEGSYMPCFLAGVSVAKSIAGVLRAPLFKFSHQEGHIEAAEAFNGGTCHAFHMSGGTCEILEIKERDRGSFSGYDIEIIGGSKDISFGQLLDRLGVAMGMPFPSGAELDGLAIKTAQKRDLSPSEATCADGIFTKVKTADRWIHLSGTETQGLRYLERNRGEISSAGDSGRHFETDDDTKEKISLSLMVTIRDAILRMTSDLEKITLSGGVSESRFIREALKDRSNIDFAPQGRGSDNAIGISLLGGKMLWR